MPYTLLKFLLWFGLAALIGFVIGWLLRSLKCRAEVANARSVTVDDDDVERMRHRLANLEQVVAERDRLRMQVADLRAADSPGVVGAAIPTVEEDGVVDEEPPAVGEPAEEIGDGPSIMPEGDDVAESMDATDSSTQVAGLTAVPDLVDDTDAESTDDDADAESTDDDAEGDGGPSEVAEAGDDPVAVSDALDLGTAATALGKKIKLDDLTVVEGIGPKISELCRGIGIETWRGLAGTDLADLRAMLDAAGPRYQIHQPGTWPQQAELLATGQWDAFVALTDSLDHGR